MQDSEARAPEPLVPEGSELPDLGDDTRLVLMPVDPYSIFAYWNVAPAELAAAEGLLAQSEPRIGVLRFHEITGPDFDVAIDLQRGKHYVRLWTPERKYRADLGLLRKDGGIVALARSNVVETPPAWPHVKVEEVDVAVEPSPPAPPADVREGAPRPKPRASVPPDVREEVPAPALSERAQQSSGPALAEPAQQPCAPGPAVSGPPDAGAVLKERLAYFSALRDEPLSEHVDGNGKDAAPPPPRLGRAVEGVCRDLTEESEAQFVPGVSSVLGASRKSGQ